MHEIRIPALVCLTAVSSLPAAGVEYHNAEQLRTELERLAARSDAVALDTFGASRLGQPLWVLTLAAPSDKPADRRTALLVTAGLDGDRLGGTEVILRMVDKLIDLYQAEDETVAALLADRTVYFLPRINPDAHTRFFATPRWDGADTLRPVDDDRDGNVDEDGPEDLNGDGLITMMRVVDPLGTHLADEKEPRLLREADAAKGEKALYKIYVEGLDNDGDELYNEDPPGGVDLNRNFQHEYEEHGQGAGPYQLCEPESRALVDFVLAHPRIAAAITLGRHNNLLNVKSDGKKDHTKKAPTELLEEDAAIYKHVAKRFKELTEIEKAPSPPSGGAFYAWAYAQYGIPSFATSVWQRPKPEEEESDQKDDGEEEAESSDKTGAEPEPERPKERSRGHGGKPSDETHVASPLVGGEGKKKKEDKKADKKEGKKKEKKEDKDEAFEEDLAWLKYGDALGDGAGFVDWTPFDHPTLGNVEIGGFVPFFKTNPPPDALDDAADKQLKFLLDVGGRLPNVELGHVEVTERHANVFEIKALLTNSGYFPSGLTMAEKNRRVRPVVVTLDAEPRMILGGERVHKVWRIAGSGGDYELRWMVQGRRGESVTIRVTSEKYGEFDLPVRLESTGGAR